MTASTVAARIPVGKLYLNADLQLVDRPRGVIVFAHGSGSSRHSPRNRYVAEELNRAGFATLLLDLLDVGEEHDRAAVFDVSLLAGRLTVAVEWAAGQTELRGLPVGLFGASTGTAAALTAASVLPDTVAAVVSRGGRPDLAGDALAAVRAPTLLIVGGADDGVIDLNAEAAARMTCVNQVVIVPNATHLFPEPGALEEVARLAADWFGRHLAPPAESAGAD